MCKDIPIYDIKNNIVLNQHLVPRQFKDTKDFKSWKKSRSFVESNISSRGISQNIPSNWIERKRQLSLSDCYWIKYKEDKMTFMEISPYLNPFISVSSVIKNSSVPALTLAGSFNKEWIILPSGKRIMRKTGFKHHIEAEYKSIKQAEKLNISCNSCKLENDSIIQIDNISNLDWMLLDYNQLGIKVNGFSPKQIASPYKNVPEEMNIQYNILRQVLFDAVVGNNDRYTNMGNLAIFKNTQTGEISYPPMFDFNLSHVNNKNLYLGTVADCIIHDGFTIDALDILNTWQGNIDEPTLEYNRIQLIELLKVS